MGLLSFLFGSKKDVPVQEEVSSKILPEIKEEDFVDNSDPNEDLYGALWDENAYRCYLCLY